MSREISGTKRKGDGGTQAVAKRRKKNSFIDDQALVNHHDSEEDDEEEGDGFVVPDGEGKELETAGAPTPAYQERMGEQDRTEESEGINEIADEDLEDLASQMVSDMRLDDTLMHRETRGWNAFDDTQLQLSSLRKLEPSDWLWEVGCKHGDEDRVVLKILRRAFHPTMPIRVAKTVFSNPNMGGRVFIEAGSKEEVEATISGVTGVRSRTITKVPQQLCARLLHVYRKPEPGHGDWVILRKSKDIPSTYDGAFAWVLQRHELGGAEGHFHVVTVPRWERESLITLTMAGSDPGDGEPVAPFTVIDILREVITTSYAPAELEEAEENGDVMGRIPAVDGGEDWKVFKYKGEYTTSDGMRCFWDISRSSLTYDVNDIPDRETIERFRGARYLAGSGTLVQLDRHHQREMKPGDRVYINEGRFESMIGGVESITESIAKVHIDSIDATVEVALKWLRYHFVIWDTIKVIEGEYVGHWGWILAMKEGSVDIFVQELGVEVEIKLVNITFHDPEVALCNLNKLDLERFVHDRDLREERRQGRKDPNRIYLRKRVMITGKGHWKGQKGIIIAIDYAGVASVELRTLSSYVAKIPLGRLRLLRRDDTVGEDLMLFNATSIPTKNASARDKKGKKKLSIAPVAGPSGVSSTPMPTSPTGDDGSPAWRIDEADREPVFIPPPFPLDVHTEPIDFLWLRDERCKKFRISVRQVCSKKAARYLSHLLDIEEVSEDGKQVRVRFIRQDSWLDWDEVRPLKPSQPAHARMPRPLVTPHVVTNPHFGEAYVLSKIQDGHVKLRPQGQKNVTKKNPELDCRVEECVVVSSIKKVT